MRQNRISHCPRKSMSNRSSVTYRRDFVPSADIRVRSPRSHDGSPDLRLGTFRHTMLGLDPSFRAFFLFPHSTCKSFKMLRHAIVRPSITANRALLQRSFSAVAPRMGEGDTGAPRSGAGGTSGYVALPSLHLTALFISFMVVRL